MVQNPFLIFIFFKIMKPKRNDKYTFRNCCLFPHFYLQVMVKMVLLADFFSSNDLRNEGEISLRMDIGMVTHTKILNMGVSHGGGLMVASISTRKWWGRYSGLVGGDGNLE